VLSDSPHAIEHGTSRTGRWLEARRFRLALWVAVAEAIIVLFSHDLTKWTVIVLAIAGVVLYAFARNSRSQIVRELTWIFATSQLLAALASILGFVVKWALITAIVVGAVLGLVYLFLDRR
jgi:membrane-associated PAP2 superfamily phosphatase